jgi:hypothetical protein
MRKLVIAAACLALAACTTAPTEHTTTIPLAPADAATGLMTGPITQRVISSTTPPPEGMDPVVRVTLTHADGRVLGFQEGNHTNDDLAAQAPGGPLAQAMGLFGEESPTLFHAVPATNTGAPFLCGAEGPAALGIYDAEDGSTMMVGLKSGFEFETLADGTVAPLPFSPDHVCARLRFRRG